MRFKILACSTDQIQEGTVIDYGLKVRVLSMKWRSLIRSWNPPHHFIDEQIHGPYRRWVHLHTFESVGENTRIGDKVDYSVPGGKIVERLFVRNELKRIFDFRLSTLDQLMNKSTASSPGLN